MSDIQLFRLGGAGIACELPGRAVAVEKHLQNLIESQMETCLGVRFIATEYTTGSASPIHRRKMLSLPCCCFCLS